ncbi:unnamed protein product, partial [Ectocarpus sp. 13 AM-2016]
RGNAGTCSPTPSPQRNSRPLPGWRKRRWGGGGGDDGDERCTLERTAGRSRS